MKTITCGFIGLGLIGGSIAKALKASGLPVSVLACDPNPDTLTLAAGEGIADQICSCPDPSFSACDFLFLCAPVSPNNDNLERVKEFLSPKCILTDVGSVKTTIHTRIKELQLTGQFIGGHPMAGSERCGYRNARARLLENAYYILTPEPDCPAVKLERYRALVQAMGAIPLVLDYGRHDYITAAISHLPHIIASSLVNLVKESDDSEGLMKLVAAGGFKDITRIASSSPAMWQQVCLTNTGNISALLNDYISSLHMLKQRLDRQDEAALYDFFDSARLYRDSFIEASSGPIKKVLSINVDIPDQPGALASIATLLALNNINIKNIGIVHNREYEEGVLRIEFYEEDDIEKAIRLLNDRAYICHRKK